MIQESGFITFGIAASRSNFGAMKTPQAKSMHRSATMGNMSYVAARTGKSTSGQLAPSRNKILRNDQSRYSRPTPLLSPRRSWPPPKQSSFLHSLVILSMTCAIRRLLHYLVGPNRSSLPDHQRTAELQ